MIGIARRTLLSPPLTRLCQRSFFDPPGRQSAARLQTPTARPYQPARIPTDGEMTKKTDCRRGHALPVFQALRSETPKKQPNPPPLFFRRLLRPLPLRPSLLRSGSGPASYALRPTLPAHSLRFAAAPPAHAPSGRRSCPCGAPSEILSVLDKSGKNTIAFHVPASYKQSHSCQSKTPFPHHPRQSPRQFTPFW